MYLSFYRNIAEFSLAEIHFLDKEYFYFAQYFVLLWLRFSLNVFLHIKNIAYMKHSIFRKYLITFLPYRDVASHWYVYIPNHLWRKPTLS